MGKGVTVLRARTLYQLHSYSEEAYKQYFQTETVVNIVR